MSTVVTSGSAPRVVSSQEEAERQLKSMVGDGWGRFLPCDSPEEALLGVVAYRFVNNETGETVQMEPSEELGDLLEAGVLKDEATCVQWPVFGKPLVPDDQVVEPTVVADFLREHVDVKTCDDPRRLLIGFVAYNPEAGTSTVRRVRISKLRRKVTLDAGGTKSTLDRDDTDTGLIISRREALLPSGAGTRETFAQRQQEVAALEEAARRP